MLRSQQYQNHTIGLCKSYIHARYTFAVVHNWQIQEIDQQCTLFYGPRIGALRVTMEIKTIPKKESSYKEIARQTKSIKKSEENYTVLEARDISQGKSKAYMNRVSWYNPNIDVTLVTRTIFTETKDTIFVLSCMIPNAIDLERIDWETFQMMQTFKLNKKK